MAELLGDQERSGWDAYPGGPIEALAPADSALGAVLRFQLLMEVGSFTAGFLVRYLPPPSWSLRWRYLRMHGRSPVVGGNNVGLFEHSRRRRTVTNHFYAFTAQGDHQRHPAGRPVRFHLDPQAPMIPHPPRPAGCGARPEHRRPRRGAAGADRGGRLAGRPPEMARCAGRRSTR